MPFAPGQSGNPSGAKREKKFVAALNRAIASDDSERLRQAAEKLLDEAAAGQPWAIDQLANRLDGRPAQAVEVSGDQDNPVQLKATVEFVNADPATKGP
jgi:HPt (histidine-containing phosphotransfer) domain-containing protein